MYKILSKGSFVQCTSAARGSAVVAGSSKLWLRAMTLKVNSVKIDVNCQHQMLQQSAFQYFPSNSFKIRIHFYTQKNVFITFFSLYFFFFSDNFVKMFLFFKSELIHICLHILQPQKG